MSNSNYQTAYSVYNELAKKKQKINILEEFFPELPKKKYQVIYADPPWDYGGKLQFDKSSTDKLHFDPKKKIFISSASFKYPTVKLKQLMQLNISNITADDALLFMWTTGPQLANAIKLGEAWGFEYKTVGFVWNKMKHNPGQYTMSQTEQVLIFKKGRIPKPRGARNIKQLFEKPRTLHSEKPKEISDFITQMFPEQEKIELFARVKQEGWDFWGLDVMDQKTYLNQEQTYQNKLF